MPIEEYHVLMLTSFIAAALCMSVISIILSRKVGEGGIVPLLYAVWMFSFAWFFVLFYIFGAKSLSFGMWFIFWNKIFLIAGYFHFVIGLRGFSKDILARVRRKDAEESKPKPTPKPKLLQSE